jgi:hypothetical protein
MTGGVPDMPGARNDWECFFCVSFSGGGVMRRQEDGNDGNRNE